MDHGYEPKGQEFGFTLFEDFSHIENVDNTLQAYCTNIMSMNILEIQENTGLNEIQHTKTRTHNPQMYIKLSTHTAVHNKLSN